MIRVTVLAVSLALAACASLPPGGGPIRGGGVAALGQPTLAGRLVVTPLAVVEDSRCPVDVQCVWAGRVRLRVRVDGAPGGGDTLLTLGQPLDVAGTWLTLVRVEPEKRSRPTMPPTAYRFTFAAGPRP